MFADVVVFSPTDPAKNFFTYSVPQKLSKDIAIGQLVSVPWGKKTSLGLIVELKKETQVENPKEILKLLSSIPILLPEYIKLLKWMSWYYHAPMLDCLKAMLPNLRLPHIANRISQKASNKQQATSDKQQLILVPTITQFEPVVKRLNNTQGILIYHKQLSKKEIWKSWWQIYKGEKSIIIGTRSALFTPIRNLTKIEIIDENDTAFKDERSPYFDTLTVAKQLCQITGAKLTIKTSTPRVETYFRVFHEKTSLPYFQFGKKSFNNLKTKPKITIINLFEKRKVLKNLTISDTLRNLLVEKINAKGSILLFLNRLKESGQIYCVECKFSGYSATSPEVCPNCQGNNFKFFSLNLKSVAREVSKLAPKVGIELVTERKTVKLQQGKPRVILATSAIFTKPAKKFALIGVISADTILNLPDFNSSLRTFSTLVKLTQLADKAGEVLIQTYNPQHPAIKYAAIFELDKFYHEELILRKKLDLPPYFVMAKLVLKLKNREKAQVEAEKLKSDLEKKSLLVEISDPVPNWQDKPEFHIILKGTTREELEPVLAHVPAKWKVVVDPPSLL